jgi:maltokinase
MTSMVEHAHAAPADGLENGQLARLLTEWLPRQRWYSGKGARIAADGVTVLRRIDLLGQGRDPALALVVAEVRPQGREPERYQLFLGLRRRLPEGLEHAELGPVHDAQGVELRCYDALHDPELAGWLLSRLAGGEVVGPLRFHLLPGRKITKGLRSLVLTGEQSNTSVIYGDKLISKFLRRAVSGVNPDLELSLALADAGCQNIPRPVGWIDLTFYEPGAAARGTGEPNGAIEGKPGHGREREAGAADPSGGNAAAGTGAGPAGAPGGAARSGYAGPEPITVATVSEFLPTATDGWLLAQASVRDLYAQPESVAPRDAGGDFGPESLRLGAATARVHHDLATALPTGRMEPEDLEQVAAAMIRHLHRAAGRVPALNPYVPALRSALSELAGIDKPVTTQRVHGDFHLGQVMRTVQGWVLLDFEGEPSRTLEERRAMAPAIKDIAGMARSFDYAAHHLGGDPDRAADWAEHNFDAFCVGYASVSGHDPREQDVLLRGYAIDKAVYEAVYEAANRPTWLGIPLTAVARLAESV